MLAYLETRAFPGIFKKVVESFLNSKVRELLPDNVISDTEFRTIIANPREYFETVDQDEIRNEISLRYLKFVNVSSPEHDKQALIAYIEFALGNYATSLTSACFAINESEVEEFGVKFHMNFPEAANAIIRSATLVAETLVAEARKYKAQTGVQTGNKETSAE